MQRRRTGFMRDERGVALIEFVIVLPLLLILIFMALEFTRYLLINIKVQSAAYAMANSVTQYPPASNPPSTGEINLNALLVTLGTGQLTRVLFPFGDASKEGMIISSIRKESAANPALPNTVIKWQLFNAGAIGGITSMVNGKSAGDIGTGAAFVKDQPTAFDTLRNPAASPANLASLLEGENFIVVEIFYDYQPLYTSIFPAISAANAAFDFPGLAPQTIARQVFMRPRNGALICLPGAGATFLYPECS